MKARIKATGLIVEIKWVYAIYPKGSQQTFYVEEIELIPDEPETIKDGHGNTWSKKCDVCGNDMQVVRPGSAICVKCNDEILANDGMKPESQKELMTWKTIEVKNDHIDKDVNTIYTKTLKKTMKMINESTAEPNQSFIGQMESETFDKLNEIIGHPLGNYSNPVDRERDK